MQKKEDGQRAPPGRQPGRETQHNPDEIESDSMGFPGLVAARSGWTQRRDTAPEMRHGRAARDHHPLYA